MFKYILTTLLTLGLFAGVAHSYTLKRGPGLEGNSNDVYINNYADWQNFWYKKKRNDDRDNAHFWKKTNVILTDDLVKNTLSEPDGALCNDDTNCAVFHAEPGCSGDAGSGVDDCYGDTPTDWKGIDLTIDCQGHAFVYDTAPGGDETTGEIPDTERYAILRIDQSNFGAAGDYKSATTAKFTVQNCHFSNLNATTRQSAITVDHPAQITTKFINITDNESAQTIGDDPLANNTRSIRYVDNSDPYYTVVYDSRLSRGIGHDDGAQNYNWALRDNLLCSGGVNKTGDVGIYWDAKGSTFPTNITTDGLDYVNCNGYAVYLRHTDLKESNTLYDEAGLSSGQSTLQYFIIGDDATSDDAGQSPPRLSSHHSTNAEFLLGSNDSNSAPYIYGIAATDGITLEGEINGLFSAPATCASFANGTSTYRENFLSAVGGIFDISHATDTSAKILGSLNVKLKSNIVSQVGEVCAPGQGIPANFMSDEMEDACVTGVNGCTGIIDLPGVGKWQILNSGYQMLPGTFQWKVTDNDNDEGEEFCDKGLDNTTVSTTDGGVSGGLVCNTEFGVRNLTDGTQGACGDDETDGDILVAYCDAPRSHSH